MASSDDEGDTVPQSVSNYHFVNDKDEPITFAELPVNWNNQKTPDEDDKQIFLYGTADNGLRKVYKQVTAWKYDLSNAKPEILVLSKENNWISLLKPRKSFEDMIRTILITVHCLHYLRKNPEVLEKALFDYLSRVLSSHEVRPSENDLVDHMDFIAEAVKRDEALAKSKFLVTFLEQKPRKREAIDDDVGKSMAGFITDDYMIVENEEDESSDEEADLFDSVCAICDNGGVILPCEGSCLRSFHATVDAGTDSTCDSLGLSDEQVDAIQNFFCKNCQYKQHQCFACGKLGSSNKSTGAEVFSCVSATCGRFYHPHCVAKLLHRDDEAGAEALKKKIAAGDSFTCPIHKCFVCKQGENKTEPDLQFAVCRRCPKSYHRKCLPRKIAFEDREEHGIIQRAWEGLIPDRILIYCLKHEIDGELGTPVRNHIKFPNIGQKKKKPIPESRENVTIKERITVPKDTFVKRIVKPPKVMDKGDTVKKREPIPLDSEPIKKRKLMKPSSKKSQEEGKPSLGDRLYATYFPSTDKDNEQVEPKKDDSATQLEQTQSLRPIPKRLLSLQPLDDDSKDRIKALMRDASSSITLEEIVKQHKVPTTHTSSLRYGVDKTITLGKVEGSIVAIRAALQKLEEEDCSIEDAKAVCEPGLLNQIIKWKGKLRVYLAPFLFGPRYTSFGRHFTKVDKLKQIVEKVRWYVQDGDMVVDFCCGANDFSCLMKKRIDEMGKKCSYKNYDVLQAKNDFNFEKRDWMTVTPDELPTGSQLIMGLNPPFGVNASLANKFINKALEFRPKLVILIVPQETERLDRKKRSPYDLVWEDDELLAGKSFYLPGSVDINNKQLEQWNNNTPPLYLWSRPDWTSKHKAVAEQHGHISRALPKELSLPPPVAQKDTHLDVEMSISDGNRVEKKEDTVVEVEQTSAAVADIVKKQSREDGKSSSSRGEKGVGKSSDPKVKRISSPGPGCSGRSVDRADSYVRPNRSSPPSHDDITARSQLSSGYSGARDDDGARQYTNEDPYPNYTALTEYQGSSRGSGYRYMADEMSHARPFHAHADDHMMNQRSPYIGGTLDSGYSAPYHQLGSSAPASTSAMQRYAPRLDELNPYMNPYDPLAPRPGVQPDPMPFAPGQFGPYPPHNSSGWLNE